MLKNKVICLMIFTLSSLLGVGCANNKEAVCISEQITANIAMEEINTPNLHQVNENEEEINSTEKEKKETVKVLVEDYYVQIPCEWMIESTNSYSFEGKPILQIEVNTYEEAVLKNEFGYITTEECIDHFIPNGIYEEERKTVLLQEVGLQGVQMKCTADQYSEEKDCFVASDDEVYLVYVPDNERQKIYTFFFLNDMAEESKISEFFQTIEIFDVSEESMDGAYRWMMED